jgi:hypothetical protein
MSLKDHAADRAAPLRLNFSIEMRSRLTRRTPCERLNGIAQTLVILVTDCPVLLGCPTASLHNTHYGTQFALRPLIRKRVVTTLSAPLYRPTVEALKDRNLSTPPAVDGNICYDGSANKCASGSRTRPRPVLCFCIRQRDGYILTEGQLLYFACPLNNLHLVTI